VAPGSSEVISSSSWIWWWWWMFEPVGKVAWSCCLTVIWICAVGLPTVVSGLILKVEATGLVPFARPC
jgi:hypothetical protein